jgi:hypothetical protein
MFILHKHKAKLHSVNARAEKHGNERVPAFDLKLSVDMENSHLNGFHTELLNLLYMEGDQADMVGLTKLRFPALGSLAYAKEIEEVDVKIGYGIGGGSDIFIEECTVNNFKISPKEGGTVSIEFRIIAHPNEGDVGKICSFIQSEVEISIE